MAGHSADPIIQGGLRRVFKFKALFISGLSKLMKSSNSYPDFPIFALPFEKEEFFNLSHTNKTHVPRVRINNNKG